ncbi:GntR family transcriptional regulator [Sulfitobacter donghicola]|uniref:Transcriptional regulator n=1 Tax=Sulfitobacter donghicola DSW-25 = KCTC 12864 = JCM 14565 TaxID=1300350 RepID=A0A073IHJ1_9RHOB|nr:GntR family transcriptional regulator [Sulfitobacter donghicola]KEJ89249.1 transcriptional regulator [Sulfitobacter donghicola DSW-25 = KCTC 12864 = JCM 14565]KIN69044.1 GntR family transcriptional regulator [Sulfitobacter donghicola DSW-25 = KCTC 12864 = JCM 14565]
MGDSAGVRKAALLEALRTRVLTQAIVPGADLDEASLSEEFGLSRTPLREALRELAGEGYVDLTRNRGARAAEMSHHTLRDFFLAAPMIYGAILRLAATHAMPLQIEALKQAQIQFRSALNSGDTAAKALANNRFHIITGDMAANIYLNPSFKRLLIDHARISMTFYSADESEETSQAADQHDEMIQAIVDRNPEAAAKLAEDHWALSRHRITQFVMPEALNNRLGDPSDL